MTASFQASTSVALGDDIKAEIAGILRQPWAARDGKVVPTSESVALNGGRVDIKGTLFYADLADSTRIAVANREAAARLFRAYLSLTARIIRARPKKFASNMARTSSSSHSSTAPT